MIKNFTLSVKHLSASIDVMMTIIIAIPAWAQNVPLKGKVTDTKGQPLPGVSVKVDGSQKGVSTDANGNFQFSLARPATLTFTSIGFTTKKSPLTYQATLNIRIVQDMLASN